MDTISIYNEIYRDVFCNTYRQTCYVFLCGGAGKEHIRNDTRALLEEKRLQILYPEDLFMEMLNRNKKSDLLEYENFLAENADIICVICESMGSAVELGAFVQNEGIREKMVVAINRKFARDKSFIMMGPAKHIRKNDANRIVIYKQDDLEKLRSALVKSFHKIHKKPGSPQEESFDKLSTYIAFIPMIVYFFQRISRKQLFHDLKVFLKDKDTVLPQKYNELFNVAVKYLLKNGILVTDFNDETTSGSFSLSQKGYRETRDILSRSVDSKKTLLHDRIRCAIMKEQLNN